MSLTGPAVIAYQASGLPCSGGVTPWKGPAMTDALIRTTTRSLALAVMLTGSLSAAVAAQALPPLSQNTYVTDRLIAARVADRIRRTCPTISARLIYAYTQARALKNYALKQGYSNDQIEAFLDDKAEKRKIYATAEKYLADNGATEGNVEGFCALGRKEIDNKTIAGSLIYAN